jgi:hypothetical protein
VSGRETICTDSCIRPKIGSRTEHCKVCHQSFTSTHSGDMHRVGEHGVDRRCLTVTEMQGKGMRRNSKGIWTSGGSYWGKD